MASVDARHITTKAHVHYCTMALTTVLQVCNSNNSLSVKRQFIKLNHKWITTHTDWRVLTFLMTENGVFRLLLLFKLLQEVTGFHSSASWIWSLQIQFNSELTEHLLSSSVYVREDPVRHTSTVCVPRQAIFGPTLSFVPVFSVDQQDGKVDNIKVRQKMGESYKPESENRDVLANNQSFN